jgi:hypothetical protein
MAPSAVESVQQTVDEIKQKVLPINEKQASEVSPAQTGNGLEEALPARYENHKEPLKLSGALDQLEHFDVTPVIGREYVNVDLVELLRAPNSDELLRDLAITSLLPPNRPLLADSHC